MFENNLSPPVYVHPENYSEVCSLGHRAAFRETGLGLLLALY